MRVIGTREGEGQWHWREGKLLAEATIKDYLIVRNGGKGRSTWVGSFVVAFGVVLF